MEFRNTPPRVSPQGRPVPELLEDLCVALRDVAVRDHSMSTYATAESWIREVVSIATELERRQVDVSERLDRLSEETGWLMKRLLDDCKAFPAVDPHVRGLDGIRRYFRCDYCRSAERPEDDMEFGACNACLGRMIQSFESLTAIEPTVLFRTYNAQWRCGHADENTVLLAPSYEAGVWGPGRCRQCVETMLRDRSV